MNRVNKRTGTFKTFDGTTLYYEVRGEGPPIIMAYGIGCLINHWQNQIRYFSRGYQTIVFDYRGHHHSHAPANLNNLTMDDLAEDIRHLCAHLEIKKASFLGHSFGVQVLLATYEKYPELFHDMVFVNGFAKNPIRGMFGNDMASQFFAFFKKTYAQLPQTLNFLWKRVVENPLMVPVSSLAGGFNIELTSLKDIEIYARGMASMRLEVFITLFEEMMEYDGQNVLETIKVPTLIIGGTKDALTPQSHQEEMHRKIKGSQLLMAPFGSHCTQLDLPELVNLRIEKFYHDNNYGSASIPT